LLYIISEQLFFFDKFATFGFGMAQKVKIGIVEDEVIIADSIRMTLQSLGYQVPMPCANYDQGVAMLEREMPDLALLDIKLGKGKDGIEVGKYIRAKLNMPIIFLTANSDSETVERAKAVNPNAFLVKPFQKEHLYAAIEIAINNFIYSAYSNNNIVDGSEKKLFSKDTLIIKDALFIPDGNYFQKVPLDEIIYLNVESDYVTIHTKNRNFTVKATLQEYLEKHKFTEILRIHERFAVNIHKIDKVSYEYLFIENEVIPISKAYRDELADRLKIN
jgi:DNA-binding LytR/AlgR family response regulator